jgi:hypothetical protein
VRDARLYFQNDQKQLDEQGMRFASSQLMVYEANKDVIRQLSDKGLNVAGKFMKQTLGEHGHGKGTTRGI